MLTELFLHELHQRSKLNPSKSHEHQDIHWDQTRISQWNFQKIMNLVGGWSLPLWKKWKSIGMIIPNLWEDKKCSKPPTRWHILTCDFALHSELCSPANKVIVFPFWVIILSMTQAQQVSKSVNHQNVHDFAFFKHWWHQFQLPSGKQPQTYGTSTFFYREKNTTRLFPIAMLNHQGVALHTHHPRVFPKLI